MAEAMRWLAPADQPQESVHDGDRPRVLVVDDNADMRDYISSLLAGRYSVETAPDGVVALELARSDPPELVITDVMMPNLDGFGLLAGLQADPATTGVPVIMVSARAGEDGTIEGLEAGADDYLIKPFAARELLARVQANIELDRARRTRDALRRSSDLLDQAQRLARVGSWDLDLETGALNASPELLRQLQMTPEELDEVGFAGVFDTRVHPDDAARVSAALEAAADGAPLDFELRLVTPDGAERLYRAIGELERDEDGPPAAPARQPAGHHRAEARRAGARARRRRARGGRRASAGSPTSSSAACSRSCSFAAEQLDVAAYYRAGVAGTQVGGDWFDVIDLGAGRTALVLGDVVGRGVRAAAVMGRLRTAVRAYAQLELTPADVLESLDTVVSHIGPEQIVTCLYAVFDPRDGSLTYANAGHLPPLAVAPGEAPRRLGGSTGPPLGTGAAGFGEHYAQLVPGTLLALYTDGLVERRDRVIDVGIDRLADALGQAADGPLAGLPDALVAELVEDDVDDDVALLVARVLDALPQDSVALPGARRRHPPARGARVRHRRAGRLGAPALAARRHAAALRRAADQRDDPRQGADRAAPAPHRRATC